MEKLKVLSLFSGIGGWDLGLERTGGFQTVRFCEIDPYARAILAKHWPDVPCHDDVTTMEFTEGEADVIAAGWPCQDLSYAGKGAGLAGERSGLWREVVRAVGMVRPSFVCLENVSALLGRGLGDVLGDLAALGYDAVWNCIPASAVGAPHRRDRIWIVAYAGGEQHEGRGPEILRQIAAELSRAAAYAEAMHHERRWSGHASWWSVEPDVGRVADGVPKRVDRLRCLGNAVVPQIPEIIGRSILSCIQEKEKTADEK